MRGILKRIGCYRFCSVHKTKNFSLNTDNSKMVFAGPASYRFFSAFFRHNVCTDDWVAFHGRERLNRPHQMRETRKADKSKTPMYDKDCPFCADEEYHTSKKLLTLRISDFGVLLSRGISPTNILTMSAFQDKSVFSPDLMINNANKNEILPTQLVSLDATSQTSKNNMNSCGKERKGEKIKDNLFYDYELHVVQNKYPVVLPSECIMLSKDYGSAFHVEQPIKECSTLINFFNTKNVKNGAHACIPATGFHEVIVDFPSHYKPMSACDKRYWYLLFAAFRNRGRVLAEAPLIQSILCFKNSGAFGGASVVHPHSQLVALPIVPQQQEKLLTYSMNYFEKYSKCLFCEYISIERSLNTRIIEETEAFIAMVPYAAHIPYHINIFPKKHNHQFFNIDDDELIQLAEIMNTVFAKIDCLFNDPDYNLVVRSSHLFRGKWRLYNPEVFYHWHVEIFPRLDSWPVAGFEFGSGIMANSHLPEDDAEAYRTCKINDESIW